MNKVSLTDPIRTLPIIQGLWYGSTQLGQMERLSIESFLYHGHPYHIYSYDEIENLPKGVVRKDARIIHPTFEMIKNRDGKVLGAAFSDLFRYKLLYEVGNFWADLDVVCVQPFNFEEDIVLAAERHRPSLAVKYPIAGLPNMGVNCNVMKFPKHSREMEFCYNEAVNFDRSKLVFGEIGPGLISHCAEKFQLHRFIRPPEVFNPVNYFDFRDLVNPRKKPSITKETYAIHLWSGAWGNRTWKQKVLNVIQQTPPQIKNNKFDVSTLYGELLHKYLH